MITKDYLQSLLNNLEQERLTFMQQAQNTLGQYDGRIDLVKKLLIMLENDKQNENGIELERESA